MLPCNTCQQELGKLLENKEQEVVRLRTLLWWNHNVTHRNSLYGDDGELYCWTCHLDFKRAPLGLVAEKLDQNELIEMIEKRLPIRK